MDHHRGWAELQLAVSPSTSVKREPLGELGVKELELEPLCAMHRSAGSAPIDQRVDYFLLTTQWSGVPEIREPEKCADLQWFPSMRNPTP
ncbi:hypothetical protein GCM10009657_16260 [Oryzihumus leptocrescens]